MDRASGQGSAFDLTGRVAIVTGSSRGIGLVIAQRLCLAGAAVMRNARTSDGVTVDPIDRDGSSMDFLAADVATEEGAHQLVQAAVARFGRLDILVNNAAIQSPGSWEEAGGAAWDSMLAINLRGTHLVVRAAVSAMVAAGNAGSIINIASVRAERPGVGMLHYSTTKAAVLGLTRALAAELGPKGIRVNAVSPGLVERPGLQDSWPEGVSAFKRDAPLGRIGQPHDVANACVFLAGAASDWITGINLVVDGGITLVR